MCGRFNLRATPAELMAFFDLKRSEPVDLNPRFSIAPTQTVLGVRTIDYQGRAASFRWGLIPFWAKDRKGGATMINARAESILVKPAFRASFRGHRALIPASGFYECQMSREGATKAFAKKNG